jgi:hypothetical protein
LRRIRGHPAGELVGHVAATAATTARASLLATSDRENSDRTYELHLRHGRGK